MMRPARRPDVLVREAEGGVLVLDRRKGLIHQMNATAGFVWDRCDGVTAVEEIVASLAAEFGQPEDVVRHDVESMIGKLIALDLVQDSG